MHGSCHAVKVVCVVPGSTYVWASVQVAGNTNLAHVVQAAQAIQAPLSLDLTNRYGYQVSVQLHQPTNVPGLTEQLRKELTRSHKHLGLAFDQVGARWEKHCPLIIF